MILSALTSETQQIVQGFTHLPFFTAEVGCPYFNNRHARLRGALRVLIGKGSAEEISEEAQLFALREKIDLNNLDSQSLKKFLVDHHLGIDCSGFAYHVLEAESLARGLGKLNKSLHRPFLKNPIRKFLAWLRPIENTGVGTLSHPANTQEVNLKDIQAGDMIIMLKSGPKKDYNHVLIITKVEGENGLPNLITYIHSFQWSKDGQYDHGVRDGEIKIQDLKKPLLEAVWTEKGLSGLENETFSHAKGAETLTINRLKWFK